MSKPKTATLPEPVAAREARLFDVLLTFADAMHHPWRQVAREAGWSRTVSRTLYRAHLLYEDHVPDKLNYKVKDTPENGVTWIVPSLVRWRYLPSVVGPILVELLLDQDVVAAFNVDVFEENPGEAKASWVLDPGEDARPFWDIHKEIVSIMAAFSDITFERFLPYAPPGHSPNGNLLATRVTQPSTNAEKALHRLMQHLNER